MLLRAPKYGRQLAEHVRSLVANSLLPQGVAPTSDEVAQVRQGEGSSFWLDSELCPCS